MKKFNKLYISIIVTILVIVGFVNYNKPTVLTDGIEIHFIDVGQADSILIKTPDKTMLIDAGNNEDGANVVNYIKNQNIQKLDFVVGTHPHEDHIGGLDDVINSFNVGIIYLPNVSADTKTYKDMISAAKNRNLLITNVIGLTNVLDEEYLDIDFVAPNSAHYDEANNYSIVTKLVYKNTSFLFEGDAEEISENEMLNYNIDVDLIKVAHHGSASSSSNNFVGKVTPKYGIITVGNNNKYGHPSQNTIKLLQNFNTNIYRTDENGTIIVKSDGKNIKVISER